MQNKTPLDQVKPGTTVFNLHGAEAVFVALLPQNAGCLVTPQIEYYYGDEVEARDGPNMIWPNDEVFLSPPVAKICAEIAELEKKRDAVQTKVNDLHLEQLHATQKANKVFESLKQFKPLERLEELLTKGVTHYVSTKRYSGGFEIIPIGKTKEDRYISYGKGGGYPFKLLSLYGLSDGDLEWHIHEYYDGSGSSRVVIPCVSYEEALVRAQEFFDSICAKKREYVKDTRRTYSLVIDEKEYLGQLMKDFVTDALGLKLAVPNDVTEAVKYYEEKAETKRIEGAKKKYDKAREEYENASKGKKADGPVAPWELSK